MDTLIVENFRCFAGHHEVPIRPLTLLVGENSTGKTSFLAAIRAAQDLHTKSSYFGVGIPDFNYKPFRLGSYDQIAHTRAGHAGQAKTFAVGLVTNSYRFRDSIQRQGQTRVQKVAQFRSIKDQPSLATYSAEVEDYGLTLELQERRWVIDIRKGDRKIFTTQEDENAREFIPFADFLYPIHYALSEYKRGSSEQGDLDSNVDDVLYKNIMFAMEPRAYAFAPIRTNPQRTYDPTTEVRDPEVSHIPMMLKRLLDNGDEAEFRKRLEGFGRASGLYSKVAIRKLGKTGSDPFQIEVKLPGGGRRRNLVDVGYGVSQALPIIADCVEAERSSILLIQQPEVHLHPRAQAAMGTFFVELAASQRNRLVVETHSDNLLDRVRMEVSDEKISCDDVVILYFEQCRQGVQIYPITLDKMGNLLDVPAGYRDFFLEEQNRFFGID